MKSLAHLSLIGTYYYIVENTLKNIEFLHIKMISIIKLKIIFI